MGLSEILLIPLCDNKFVRLLKLSFDNLIFIIIMLRCLSSVFYHREGVLDFKAVKRYFTNNFYMSIISSLWKHIYREEKID